MASKVAGRGEVGRFMRKPQDSQSPSMSGFLELFRGFVGLSTEAIPKAKATKPLKVLCFDHFSEAAEEAADTARET